MLIPGAGAEWSMWPGARMAGLGGPCGRMKRKKIRHSEIAALVMMRRVSWRFAMVGGGKEGRQASDRGSTWD
jgi:hypothetical protein